MRKLSLLSFMILALGLASCGSDSKKSDQMTDQDPPSVEDQSSNRPDIMVNSDSDSQTAGGLRTVYFNFNSANLGNSTQSALNDNAEFLRNNPGVKVTIEGHCDERGGRLYNEALGERRSMAVKKYLQSLGVSGRQMMTKSWGKERPISFGRNEGAWSKNRRANFVVTSVE